MRSEITNGVRTLDFVRSPSVTPLRHAMSLHRPAGSSAVPPASSMDLRYRQSVVPANENQGFRNWHLLQKIFNGIRCQPHPSVLFPAIFLISFDSIRFQFRPIPVPIVSYILDISSISVRPFMVSLSIDSIRFSSHSTCKASNFPTFRSFRTDPP